ncbi:MAG: hypothetical protein AB7U81_06885 [Thiohalomonadaceae bacterium]
MKSLASGALVLALAAGAACAASPGETMYRFGRLPSGEPLRGTVHGDVPLTGELVACVVCHRRSGFGASEGGVFAPPLVAPLLFAPREYRRKGWEGASNTRPAYDDATLLRALRDGIDAAGHPLSPLMPRYEMTAEQAAPLFDYLRTLGATPAAGIDAEVVHFATIITPDADPVQAAAWTGALEAFVREKNAGTRHERTRAEQAPWTRTTRYPAYRRWQLHRWELRGAPDQWPKQLAALYARQPVFAVLGGVAPDWSIVQPFCEGHAVPCLFPWTEVTGTDPRYTVYFSEGIALEARTLAQHLARTLPGAAAEVRGPDHLKALFPARGDGEKVLVLLDAPDPAALSHLDGYARIYLRAAWRPLAEALPPAVRKRVFISAPYSDLSRTERVARWLRRHRLDHGDVLTAGAALYGATIVGEALMHMGLYFSREYLLDRVEHAVSRSPQPGPFPVLSLGPEQRFAAKTARVEALADVGVAMNAPE